MPQPPKIQPQPERMTDRQREERRYWARMYSALRREQRRATLTADTRASQQATPTSWAGSTRMTPEARAYRGKGWA
jgi:hypothetical protein